MRIYFCDKCEEEIKGGASGVMIPGIDTKEFCCYKCAQQYMEKMKGKEQIKEYFCEKCNRKLGPDYCKFATEIGNYRGTFFSGHDVKFCSIKCMIEWIKRERRGVTKHISRETEYISICTYSNSEIGNVGSWQIQEERGRPYVKPKVWNELIEN